MQFGNLVLDGEQRLLGLQQRHARLDRLRLGQRLGGGNGEGGSGADALRGEKPPIELLDAAWRGGIVRVAEQDGERNGDELW